MEESTKIAEEFDKLKKLIDVFSYHRNIFAHACYFERKLPFFNETDDFHFIDIKDAGTEGNELATKVAAYNLKELELTIRSGKMICAELQEFFGTITLPERFPGTIRPTKPPSPRSRQKSDAAMRKTSLP